MFGVGTFGRDMVYSLVTMYLIYYLTDVLRVSAPELLAANFIIVAARIFDAFNDPFMGVLVDNTKTRFGKFKPWIFIGAVLSGFFTQALFSPPTGNFILYFAVVYILWGITYTANDIAYWSQLPALSQDPKEREKIGSIARIFANAGLFFTVSGIAPITNAFAKIAGSLQKGFFYFAILVVSVMQVGQLISLFGVKEPKTVNQPKTNLKELVTIIIKNDQLLITGISIALFMIGYLTTTGFGIYYFKYIYGDEGMYSIFAVVLGVSQIGALAAFPFVSRFFSREKIFAASIALVCAGYAVFFFASDMLAIGIAGVLIFVGESSIQLLTLMFLSDSVDYGHWKFGKRNDSASFSISPFVNKFGGAIASGVSGGVVLVSGINDATSAADVTPAGAALLKGAMTLFPALCVVASYVLYKLKYKLDNKTHEKIISDLKAGIYENQGNL
jgi:melibiose permease/lactose/raffinose/galactose permease